MRNEEGLLTINEQTRLPRDELSFEYSHASGPGGQNVNKVSSRVTVCLNLELSPSLSDEQKQRLHLALPGRINREGVLRVSCEESRSQSCNRETAVLRLVELLSGALLRRRRRKATRPTLSSRTDRLTEKKQRSSLKRNRRTPPEE